MVVDLAPVYGNETANSLGLDTWSGRREVSSFVSTLFSLFFVFSKNSSNKKSIYIQVDLTKDNF